MELKAMLDCETCSEANAETEADETAVAGSWTSTFPFEAVKALEITSEHLLSC
jgi:hypothetical protein